MSFLTGKQQTMSNVTEGTSALHDMLLRFIAGGGSGLDRLFPGVTPDKASMQPYLDMFTMQNNRNLAQAKESAGNLTGSSLGNVIGMEAARANTEQGAFLANLFENRRQQDASRFLQLVLGALGSPAGGVTNAYQPGFLDYAFQGLGAAAPLLAGSGGPKTPEKSQ